ARSWRTVLSLKAAGQRRDRPSVDIRGDTKRPINSRDRTYGESLISAVLTEIAFLLWCVDSGSNGRRHDRNAALELNCPVNALRLELRKRITIRCNDAHRIHLSRA